MIDSMKKHFNRILLVQIWHDRIVVSANDGGQKERSTLCFVQDGTFIGTEDDSITTLSAGGFWRNPFAHPRSLINDFRLAETLIQHVIWELMREKAKWATPSPHSVIVQAMEQTEGGLTDVERKALYELVAGHARNAHVAVPGEAIPIQGLNPQSLSRLPRVDPMWAKTENA